LSALIDLAAKYQVPLELLYRPTGAAVGAGADSADLPIAGRRQEE